MSILEELEKTYTEKERYAETLSNQRDCHKRERERHYNTIIAQEIQEKFGTTVQDAVQESNQAKQRYRDEQNRIAIQTSLSKLPYPEGTIMIQWTKSYRDTAYILTKEKGKLEIFREGDSFPLNRRWFRPSPGDLIVRLVKKDGTTGIQIDKYHSNVWFPEGIDPNSLPQI
jgi:hypothetical protein